MKPIITVAKSGWRNCMAMDVAIGDLKLKRRSAVNIIRAADKKLVNPGDVKARKRMLKVLGLTEKKD